MCVYMDTPKTRHSPLLFSMSKRQIGRKSLRRLNEEAIDFWLDLLPFGHVCAPSEELRVEAFSSNLWAKWAKHKPE